MDRNRIDSEYLIEAIKKYDSIWNKDSKDYHRKSCKESSWNQVCEELVEDWDCLSEEEKSNRLYDLKKRWNNIRDYYKKDLALQLSGRIGSAMKRKKYVFSKQLEFLRPFLDKSCKNEKGSEDDHEEERDLYLEVTYSSDSEKSYAVKRKTTAKTAEEKKNATPTVIATELIETDSDLLFLKSLVPDMKVMTREQKIEFKIGMLQLYKNIMNEMRYSAVHYDGSENNPLN